MLPAFLPLFPVFSLLLLPALIPLALSTTGTTSTVSFYDTNCFTKSQSLNSLYAIGSSNYNIYRINYTRVNFPSTLQFKASHTKRVRTMTASSGQRYLATGSEDYHVEVYEIFPKKMVCKFVQYNQLRKVDFDPNYQQILFTVSVDDVIRKYNVTNCTKVAQIDVGHSIHTMTVSKDGKWIFYGTLYGHVGYVDTNLTTFTNSLNAHRFTVLYIFNTYANYYVSIGQDSKMILWNLGSIVTNFTSLTGMKIIFCDIIRQAELTQQWRMIGCSDRMQFYGIMRVTNTSIVRISTHQCGISYLSIKWMDFRLLAPDEGQWVIHTGTSLLIHKIYYTSTYTCNPQLAQDPSLRICRHCGYLIPGCYECNSAASCSICSPGTYRTATACPDCPTQCSICSSATSCSTCAVGYEPIGSSGKCRIESTYIAGCYTYKSNGGSCQVVANGYYPNGVGNVKLCNQSKTGCMECTQSSSTSCLTCQTGYYLNGASCALCSGAMAGCDVCSNSTVCIKCAVAFKYNGANVQCSNCHPTCKTCSPFYDQCLSCYTNLTTPSQFRYLKDQKCLCIDSYYDLQYQSPAVYVCNLCSIPLTYCYLCKNDTVCIQCQPMYYLVQHTTKLECQLCNKYCQTCQGTSVNCTSCNSVNFNRVLSGSTCICQTGYAMVNGSIPCSLCYKLNDGCLLCQNETYCTSCDTGYVLHEWALGNQTCILCPYYCPDCTVNASGSIVCNSCPTGSNRLLINGNCSCDAGYFDDNKTVVCEKCSDVLSNCLTCTNRTKCTSCAPGMFTDQSRSLCAPCQSTCLSCGLYFDVCATCDPGTNRILSAGKCVCQTYAYEENSVCLLCGDAIQHCNSCTNPYICTGCEPGFTLAEDLASCIDCKAEINGCDTCTSKKNCTSCVAPFTLIQRRCRCPIDSYTSKSDWGSCQKYGIPGLQSSLGVEVQLHQHQSNRLYIFIRFRAKTLYILNKTTQQSINVSINGIPYPITFQTSYNNHVTAYTDLTQPLLRPNVTVQFASEVFYNEYLLTISRGSKSLQPARLYIYEDGAKGTYEAVKNVLKYVFMVFRWVFMGFCIIGQGHLLFPFVTIIQLLPLFLFLDMSLPANLSMVLDAMLSFQVKSIIPMFSIQSKTVVIFPPLTYDYYSLYDFFLLGKIGDMLLILFINVMTKFDEGIVRMFPPGRIRRYLYQSLVRRGYAVMSLCILSFQPSLIMLASVYITYDQWENKDEIFNYTCCLFVFGFYLAYNFNHASNLQGGKLMKNIENQHCFFGINSQEPSAPRTTLFVLASDFWLVGAMPLVGAFIYFPASIALLAIRVGIHIRPNFYIGKIQFGVRTLSNVLLLAIYSIMYVFYLGESKIDIGLQTATTLGLVATVFIFLYMLCHIVQKVLYNLKLETDFIQSKVVQGQNGQAIVVAKVDGIQDQNGQVKAQQDNQSSRSHKMKQFFNNTSSKQNGGFSGLNFRNRNKEKQGQNRSSLHKNEQPSSQKQDSNYPIGNPSANNSYHNPSTNFNPSNSLSPNYNPYNDKTNSSNNKRGKGNTMLPNRTDAFFNNNSVGVENMNKTQRQKELRIKSANTSKYAKNHLELRYKAQGILTKEPERYED